MFISKSTNKKKKIRQRQRQYHLESTPKEPFLRLVTFDLWQWKEWFCQRQIKQEFIVPIIAVIRRESITPPKASSRMVSWRGKRPPFCCRSSRKLFCHALAGSLLICSGCSTRKGKSKISCEGPETRGLWTNVREGFPDSVFTGIQPPKLSSLTSPPAISQCSKTITCFSASNFNKEYVPSWDTYSYHQSLNTTALSLPPGIRLRLPPEIWFPLHLCFSTVAVSSDVSYTGQPKKLYYWHIVERFFYRVVRTAWEPEGRS